MGSHYMSLTKKIVHLKMVVNILAHLLHAGVKIKETDKILCNCMEPSGNYTNGHLISASVYRQCR